MQILGFLHLGGNVGFSLLPIVLYIGPSVAMPIVTGIAGILGFVLLMGGRILLLGRRVLDFFLRIMGRDRAPDAARETSGNTGGETETD